MPSPTAVKRLINDLAQLKKEPIIGANAIPLEKNMMILYGIIVGVEGTPYAGVPIRFVLEFDDNYPDSPPNAFFETYIRYGNGASYMVGGRLAVCLNIFGNFHHVHTEWKNMSEGWSPAYTVSTILIAMQGLMMSEMLSNDKYDIQKTIDSAKNFKCPITKHDGSDPNLWFPKILLSRKYLEEYYKGNDIEVPEQRKFDPLRDHYICYVKKSTILDSAQLGYGVNIDNPKIGILSSPCEYISLEAFNDGIRRSSTNKPFSHWIPILVSTNQWGIVKGLFVDNIKQIAREIGFGKKDISEAAAKICSSIMNTLVVEIMNNKNNLQANDKFVDGYFAIYRLLSRFTIDEPRVIQYVDDQLSDFINKPEKRTKQYVQNLGELLIFLTISKKYTWNDIKQFFLDESDTRNVFWHAVGNFKNPAMFPELVDPSIVEGRAQKVFKATEVSRSLIMFQVRFSQVTKLLTSELMDSNCGLAPDQLRSDLKSTYNEVSKVTDWNGYFKWLNLPSLTDHERSLQLVEAVIRSEKQGYHTRSLNNQSKSQYINVPGKIRGNYGRGHGRNLNRY